MTRTAAVLIAAALLAGCRDYHSYPRLSKQDGYIPADQFARYGREQAQQAQQSGAAERNGTATEAAGERVASAKTEGENTPQNRKVT